MEANKSKTSKRSITYYHCYDCRKKGVHFVGYYRGLGITECKYCKKLTTNVKRVNLDGTILTFKKLIGDRL